MLANPEGPYIQLLGIQVPKCLTIEGIMGLNSLIVVCVDPLGKPRKYLRSEVAVPDLRPISKWLGGGL